MIEQVDTVCIFVGNQDRARDFYTRVLGFELRNDEPVYPGAANRWLAVVPPGGGAQIILYLPDENWEHYRQTVGQSQGVTFRVNNMKDLYADLLAKGVVFTQAPQSQPWGIYATMVDSEGNRLILVEPPDPGTAR